MQCDGFDPERRENGKEAGMGTEIAGDVLLEIYRRVALIRERRPSLKVLRSGRLNMPYYSARDRRFIRRRCRAAAGRGLHLHDLSRHSRHAGEGVSAARSVGGDRGRATGTCKGKGGPMHLTCPAKGVMVTTGIVGSSMPIANGLAWASKLAGDGRVTVAYFGDGASNIGAFHEALNLASVWRLPVVFVCQNNQYGEHTRYAKATSAARIADRAAAYGMPGPAC